MLQRLTWVEHFGVAVRHSLLTSVTKKGKAGGLPAP